MMWLNKKSPVGMMERRKFYRKDLLQASYFQSVKTANTALPEACQINTISAGGASFDTKSPVVDEGDEVILLYRIGSAIRKDTLRIIHMQVFLGAYRCGAAFCTEDDARTHLISRLY